MIEVSKACRPVKSKGHDRVLAVRVNGSRESYLVAVADGLASENGGAAAEWAVQSLQQIAADPHQEPPSARSIFDRLSVRLASADRQPYPQSHTTLSCGVVSAAEGTLKFDFFAIGGFSDLEGRQQSERGVGFSRVRRLFWTVSGRAGTSLFNLESEGWID